MKIQPNLIPRFNTDYSFSDMIYGVKSIFIENNSDFNLLKNIFGDKKFFFTNSGRNSIYTILHALNLPKGSKIGVPLYSCTVVFDAIIKSGHVPCFIDLDINNYTLDPLDLEDKIDDLDAVVVIHTFGRPADMDEIKKTAGDIPIIEDCAHSLLSSYKGKITGTIGDASFFSFGSGKCISAGGGSMIIINNLEFQENLLNEIHSLSDPSKFNELTHMMPTYVKSFLYHSPWYGIFLPLGKALDSGIDLTGKKGFTLSKIKRSHLAIFLNKLKNFELSVKIQKKNSNILLEELKNTPLILPYESKYGDCNYYLFPVQVPKNKRDLLHERLSDTGIDSAKLFSQTPQQAKLYYGYKNDCQNTEIIANSILTLPNYYTLNEEKVAEIGKNICNIVGELI